MTDKMLYTKLVDIYEALNSTTKRLEKTEILADFLKLIGENEPQFLPAVTLMSMAGYFPTWSQKNWE